MIDTHCHLDMYKNPHSLCKEVDRKGITVIGMTNLPSHYEIGKSQISNYKRIRLALGLHPLLAKDHINEYHIFNKYIDSTSYIGEVGLDFSKEGISTKDIQIKSFEFVLNKITDKKKLLSIHSRQAEKETLYYLDKYKVQKAIFHWYSGTVKILLEIFKSGYYASVNPVMLKSQKGRNVISNIPREKILTESDGPYTMVKNRSLTPSDVREVYEYLAGIWNINLNEVKSQIKSNFNNIISNIK